MATPDLYEILGVPRDAGQAAIKAAYRRKAKDSHPDVGGDPEEFRRLSHAYDVLSDPESRRHYDETGETPEDKTTNAAEEGRFRQMIGDLLVTLIAQAGAPEFTDILTMAQEQVAHQIVAVDQQLTTLGHLAARLGEVRHRLHGPEEETFLISLLTERLTDLETKIALTRNLRGRLIRLQERLRLYSYDVQVENIV